MQNDTLKSSRVCKLNKMSVIALQPWLVSAPNLKPAFARKLKRRFAAKRQTSDAPKKLNDAAPNTSELSRKKLPGPRRNPNFLLKSNDLKLKNLRQHQLMHQRSKSRKLPNGLKLVWKTGPRPRPSQTNRRIISAVRWMKMTASFER